MEHLKTLALLLVLWAFAYAIVQLIKLFALAVVALYTGGGTTLLMLFCVAAAAFFGCRVCGGACRQLDTRALLQGSKGRG